MNNQILKENEMYIKAEHELIAECREKEEEAVIRAINNELSAKEFDRGYRESIIGIFGLDGGEPWSVVQLAMYMRIPMDEAVHFSARVLRMLRKPAHNKVIREFEDWACKNSDSPYAKLILRVLGIANPQRYLLYTQGVEDEHQPENMSDEDYLEMKKLRRISPSTWMRCSSF